MRTIAANHADALRRATHDDSPEGLLVDTIGGALRTLYDEAAGDLPLAWIAQAARLDGSGSDRVTVT